LIDGNQRDSPPPPVSYPNANTDYGSGLGSVNYKEKKRKKTG
jgi:hypothetical protein